jgi:hypothetical protein
MARLPTICHSFYYLCITLTFPKAASGKEKQRAQLEKMEQDGMTVSGSVLDPLMTLLVQCNSLAGLKKQISDIFVVRNSISYFSQPYFQ